MRVRFSTGAALSAALLFAPVLVTPALVTPALAKDPPARDSAAKPAEAGAAKEASPGQAAARGRQKTCGTEWRGLTAAQKTAQGPKWPQFWSKCNKRLKGNDKA